MKKLHLNKEFSIAYYNVDFNGNLLLPSLLQFLQEVAWEHAEHLELGFEELMKRNLIWVLARQKIKMNEFPKFQEKIRIKTWATDKDKFFWNRDFKFFDSNDNELGRATSSWMILNLDTRRPYRDDDLFKIKIDIPERAFQEKLLKLSAAENDESRFQKNVTISDLDLNNHVNNVKYLEWVIDSYSLDEIKDNWIDTVELNYLAEGLLGDKIIINSDRDGSDHKHSVRRIGDDKELFRTRIIWKKVLEPK